VEEDQDTGKDEESEANTVMQIDMAAPTSMEVVQAQAATVMGEDNQIVGTTTPDEIIIIGMIETAAMTVGLETTEIKKKMEELETGARVVILETGRTATETEVPTATETKNVTETMAQIPTERATPETADPDQETDHVPAALVTRAHQLLDKPQRKGVP